MNNGQDKLALWGGIEYSLNRIGDRYFDQLEQAGHYDRDDDISRIAGLGIKTIRYPVLWEKHQSEAGSAINWSGTAEKLEEIRSLGINVIAGLVHHGSGPAFVHMMDESFALGLASYAGQVASRFPWIVDYTPVNEPLTTARFCGLYGIWYPHERSSSSFCRILINECKATVLAMQEIRQINPKARLVQTEDLGKTHSTSLLKYQADFENNRRWLSFDLLSGKVNNKHALWGYLLASGISETDLLFFIENKCPPDVIGINHYLTSERYLDENINDYPHYTRGGNHVHKYADIEAVRVGGICPDGPYELFLSAWKRYNLPIAITETHLHCTREEQMRWLSQIWHSGLKLIKNGVNIQAVTVWALFGSFGWSDLLTVQPGVYEAGVFDLSGNEVRGTALASMVKAYVSTGNFIHPVLSSAGWWQRKCRTLYGTDIFYSDEPKNLNTQPLLILGLANAPITEACVAVCKQRAIHYVCFDHTHLDDMQLVDTVIKNLLPWAVLDTYHLKLMPENRVKDAFKKADFSLKGIQEVCSRYNAAYMVIFTPVEQRDIPDGLGKNLSTSAKTEQAPKSLSPPREYALNISVPFLSSSGLPDILDKALDLLLDGEAGNWEFSYPDDAVPKKVVPGLAVGPVADTDFFVKRNVVNELETDIPFLENVAC
ncbi:dTDP-4-dehydrorhamnose reductase [Mucilaginibacter sp. UYP25]|uniref:family 1 glycosylhydrolase n=1 Tax=unclassified Mucilaginibacter TaxID=2617802 RepID=UPI00339633A8